MDAALQVSPSISQSSCATEFPADAVEAVLRQELVEVVAAAALDSIVLPQSTAKLGQAPFEIDSLAAVEILCAIKPLVDIELKSNLVRPGGYTSIDDATTTLLPKIEKAWKKHNGVIP